MTKFVLDRIYKNSIEQYNETASKMERRGNSIHIEANLEFQKKLQENPGDSKLSSSAFKKDIKNYVRSHSKILEANALKRGLTRCSVLEEQDEEIYENMTSQEINNAVGTKPKIDFKEQPKQIPSLAMDVVEEKKAEREREKQRRYEDKIAKQE